MDTACRSPGADTMLAMTLIVGFEANFVTIDHNSAAKALDIAWLELS